MMKAQFKSILCGTSVALLAGTMLAQTSSDQKYNSTGSSGYQSTSGQQSSTSQGTQSQQFFQAKNFIGTKVKNAQDQSLGSIKDIVFNPQTGEIFAALDAGNSKYALVPWQALTVTAKGTRGKEEVTLNATKDSLQAGPTVPEDQWEELNNKTFVQSIYSHYNVQPPTGMGGTSGLGTGGTSTGTSGSSQDLTSPKSPDTTPKSQDTTNPK